LFQYVFSIYLRTPPSGTICLIFFYVIEMSTFARLVYHIYNFLHWYYGVPLSYKVLGESRFIIVVLKKQIVLLLPNSE